MSPREAARALRAQAAALAKSLAWRWRNPWEHEAAILALPLPGDEGYVEESAAGDDATLRGRQAAQFRPDEPVAGAIALKACIEQWMREEDCASFAVIVGSECRTIAVRRDALMAYIRAYLGED